MARTGVNLAVSEVLSNVWHLSATPQNTPPLPSSSFPSSPFSSFSLFSLTLPLPLLPPSVSSPSGLASTWWTQARLGSKTECSKWHAASCKSLKAQPQKSSGVTSTASFWAQGQRKLKERGT